MITGLGDGDICFLSSYFIELGPNSLLLLNVNQDQSTKLAELLLYQHLVNKTQNLAGDQADSLVSVELVSDLH